jgi:hypothetical protein
LLRLRSVRFAPSIPIHEELNELSAGAEVCLHQPSDGIRKISKTMLGCKIENPQRALNGYVTPSSFMARRSVIGQEKIGSELLGKCNCLPLPEVENGWEHRQGETRLLYRDPFRKIFHPEADSFWAAFLRQFTEHAWRKHDCAIKDGQEMDFLDKHDVAKRTCIGNDDHCLGYLPDAAISS